MLLLPFLSGCIGVAAVPLIAGGAVVRHHSGARMRTAHAHSRARRASAASPGQTAQAARTDLTELPPPSGTPAPALAPLAALPPPSSATTTVTSSPVSPGESPQAAPTGLTALPPPSGSAAALSLPADPWQPLVAYALGQARLVRTAEQPESALLLPLQRGRRPCAARDPAVIVDLDQAGKTFAPDRAAHPASGLSEGLARLREGGVKVLWISQLPATRAAEVAGALRSSGLDPEGKDGLLLIRGRDDRKQLEREHANAAACVVALAGNQRADFDELFDYLRDPTNATELDDMLGNGWFLVPPPLTAPG
jgi:hypothetical protein